MMLRKSLPRRRTNQEQLLVQSSGNLKFFWCRPIGADDFVRRFTVVSQTQTSSTSVWARSLSYSELLDKIESECKVSNVVALEICGVIVLPMDCWDEICSRLSKWKKPIRDVSFLSSYTTHHVAKLASAVTTLGLRLLLDGFIASSESECHALSYTLILEATSHNKALQELTIQNSSNSKPPKLTMLDFEIIVTKILPRLKRLEIPSNILCDLSKQKLMEYAENHLHCLISITKTEDECQDDFHHYLEWHNQLHWYRLSLFNAMQLSHKLSRCNVCRQGTVEIVDAGIRVLKDWFRATHANHGPLAILDCKRTAIENTLMITETDYAEHENK